MSENERACPHCEEPVDGGKWHRKCAMVVIAAIVAEQQANALKHVKHD